MTFAFIERAAALPVLRPGVEPAAIANPLSEKFARAASVAAARACSTRASHNRRRERRDVRLFETGSRFTARRRRARGGASSGAGPPSAPHWSGADAPRRLLRREGRRRALAARLGVGCRVSRRRTCRTCAGTSAPTVQLTANGGRARSASSDSCCRRSPTRADFRRANRSTSARSTSTCSTIGARQRRFARESLPRFPSIVRDLSVLVDEALPAAAVRGTIRSEAPATLVSIAEFDRYQGKGVPEGESACRCGSRSAPPIAR